MTCKTIAGACLTLLAAKAAHGQYTAVNLGKLPNSADCTATDTNDFGQIVGTSGNQGFVWNGAGLLPLNPLSGNTAAKAWALNDLYEIPGQSDSRAVKWNYTSGPVTLTAAVEGWANGANDEGLIVGRAGNAFVRSSSGQFRDLGRLNANDTFSEATDVSNSGAVVGFSGNPVATAAFRWTFAGGMKALPGLTGTISSAALGVNRAGDSVGWCLVADVSGVGYRAVKWPLAGGVVSLGVFDGDTGSKALDINDRGQIVGVSIGIGTERAVMWESGVTKDLNTVVTGAGQMRLSRANAVNNNGEFVGAGTVGSEPVCFLLRPIITGQTLETFSITPNMIKGGTTTTGTVGITGPAPAAGVILSVADNTLAIVTPDLVIIPKAAPGTSFAIQTRAVSSTVTRSIMVRHGNIKRSANLTLTP